MGFSLKNLVKGVVNQVNPFDGGKTFSNPVGTQTPSSNVPLTGLNNKNYTDAPHAFGTLIAQNTADQQGFSPKLRSAVQNSNPFVVNGYNSQGMLPRAAGGAYYPEINQTVFRDGQVDPSTVTHEGLHAVWGKETPQQHQQFAQVARQANPSQQHALRRILGNQLYSGNDAETNLNETRSYLSSLNQFNQSPALSSYYKQYYSNPSFISPAVRQNNTKYEVNDAIGGYPKRSPFPQFDWWRD